MHRISSDAEYLDSGKVVIDADGIPVNISNGPQAEGYARDARLYRDAAEGYAASAAEDQEQTGLDRVAVESAKSHVDGQVAAIDTAFTDSIPPYLQPDSPTGLGANYQTAIVARRDTTTGEVDFAELQDAANRAKQEGRPLFAEGILQTDQTLMLGGDANLSSLTINYTGTGTCVQVGDPAGITQRVRIDLPKVICASKPESGWETGTVGVEINYVQGAMFTVPFIYNFETGLLLTNNSGGTAYNTFELGDIRNANNGIEFRPTGAGGWVNENKFIGGRILTGAAHSLVWFNKPNSTDNRPNNNVFIGVALEGAGPQYSVDFDDGWHNVFVACRWENSRGVRFGPTSFQNEIVFGFQAETLKMVQEPGARLNVIDSANAIRAEKDIKLSAQNKAYETVMVRPSLSQIDLGSGNNQWPETSVRWRGGDLLSLKANAVVPDRAATNLGGSTMKWQDLHLSRYIRLGSLLLRDNQGTLEVANSESGPWTVIGAAGS